MYATRQQLISDTTERIPRPVLEVGYLWNSCLQNFNVVDTGEIPSNDYVILRVKLELERIRLFYWGEAVHLAELYDVAYSSYPAFREEKFRSAALQLLGQLRDNFENPDILERKHDLRPVSESVLDSNLQSASLHGIGSATSPIFKREYSKVFSLAAGHIQQTATGKATKWVIVDKKKFLSMITTIKGLNDELYGLNRHMEQRTMQNIYDNINETRDVDVLKLLQAATAGDYENVLEKVTLKLKELGTISDSQRRHQDERNTTGGAKFGEQLDELASRAELIDLSVNKKAIVEQGTIGGSTQRIFGKVDTMPARLCYTCEKNVMIDDGWLGSVVQNQDGSEKFEYKKIDDKNPAYKPGPSRKLIDDLPDLPRLRARGDGAFGCSFCRFLRRSILKNFPNEQKVRQRLEIELVYVFQGSSTPGPFALKATLSPKSILYPPQLMFPLVTNAGDCAEWLHLEPIIRDPLDSRSIEILQNFTTEPPATFKSTPRSGNKFLPTRLLEIEPASTASDTPGLRLVLKEELDQKAAGDREIHYAALSYCWGSASEAATQAVTKKETLRQHCYCIPKEEQTPVILDAVKTCQALNIRYLWVDALCIIQDSVTDWEAEAPKMAQVYGEAYLTICSIASTSCHEGFLKRGPTDYVEIQFQSVLRPRMKGSYRLWQAIPVHAGMELLNPYQAQGALSYSRWNTRGWTFQEFQFSSRLLCFGTLRSYLITSEKVVTELGWKETLKDALNIPLSNEIYETFHKGDNTPKAHNMWMDIVSGYTGRQLTYPKDTLPALSGIAQVFSQGLGDEYKAGLWNGDLSRQLLWTVADSQPVPLLPRASEHDDSLESLLDFLSDRNRCLNPSWSWSSRPRHSDYEMFRICSEWFPFFSPESPSLEARTVVEGSNPLGLVSEGELVITSWVKPLESTVTQRKIHKYGKLGGMWDVFLDDDMRLALHFDCVMNSADFDAHEISLVLVGSLGGPFDKENYCGPFTEPLEMTQKFHDNGRIAWGLIICSCPNTSRRDVWVRIGVFSCSGGHYKNGWEAFAQGVLMKEVIIV